MSRPEDCDRGREYLRSRGISEATIDVAEKAGMLRYTHGAVLFCGYDEKGEARSVTRRATDPSDPIQKRDLAGSDKSYPAILPGSDTVWIVEGGIDALAVRDMAQRRGRTPPTVIVSGGAAVRGFLDTPHVQDLLKRARRITIACEREKDQETQARTDQMHEWQRDAVTEVVGPDCEVRLWRPDHGKDAAEMNKHEADHARAVARAEEIVRPREIEEERERERERMR